jgi:hypothetical protein
MKFDPSVENISTLAPEPECENADDKTDNTPDDSIVSIVDTETTVSPDSEPMPVCPLIAFDDDELSPEDIDFLFDEGLPLLGFTDNGLKNIIITGFNTIKDLFLGFIGVIMSDNYSALSKHFIKTISYKIHRILVSLRQGITISANFFNHKVHNNRLINGRDIVNEFQTVDSHSKLLKHREFILTNMKAIDTREPGMEYGPDYDKIIHECKQLIDLIIKCVSRNKELVSKYKTMTKSDGTVIKCPELEQNDMIMYDKLEYIESMWNELGDAKNGFVYYVCFRELYRFTHNVSIIMKNIKMIPKRQEEEPKEVIVENDDNDEEDVC